MTFYGADTGALAALAESGRIRIGELAERRATAEAHVHAVRWVGPDADRFRESWGALTVRWTALERHALAAWEELAEHAAEQDEASSPEGDGASGSSAMPQPASGPAPAPADAPVPDPTGGEPAAPPPPAPEHHDNPEDEFSVKPGEGGREWTGKLEDDDGTVTVTRDAQGNLTTKIEVKATLVEAKTPESPEGTPPRGASLELKRELSMSAQEKDNGDGTVTYSVESKLSDSAKAEIKAKYGASAGAAAEVSETFAVTVPKGTPPERAILINPYDPASIPKGGSVVITDSAAGSVEGSATHRLATVEGTHTETGSLATAISREKDGSLSITSGPASEVQDRIALKFGTDKANVSISTTDTDKDSTVQVAEYSDDAAGRAAYDRTLNSGRFPDRAGDGVKDTYSEHTTSRTVDVTGSAKAGPLGVENRINHFSQETIERTYPSGHVERAEQWVPQGDSSPASVIVSSSSDREPTYVVTNRAGDPRALQDEYGVPAPTGDTSSIVLTQSEAERIAQGARAYRAVPEDASPAEVLSIITQSSRDTGDGAFTMETYHNVRLNDRGEPVGFDDSAPTPGRPIDPATTVVRDGQVRPR